MSIDSLLDPTVLLLSENKMFQEPNYKSERIYVKHSFI